MPWTSMTPILIWAIVFIPFTVILFRTQIKDRLTPILLLLAYTAANLFFFLVVNWALFIYWVRFLPIIVIIFYLIGYLFLSRLKHKPWLQPWNRFYIALRAGALIVLVIFGILDAMALRSYVYPAEPKVMAIYPAYTGMYVIVNGGNGLDGWFMNNSYRDWLGRPTAPTPWQAYAVDIMEIRTNGKVADGFLNTDQNKYEGSVNEPVYAPCVGVVVDKDFSHPDVKPFSPPGDLLGNRVVIQCANTDYYITVSNLMHTYDLVDIGQPVGFNNIIGHIGTSGTPSIPHVHVFATQGGWDENAPPVPIEFEFRYPVRNFLYIR